MVRRAVSILDEARDRALRLKAKAYALAPWAVNDEVADRRPAHRQDSHRP